MAQHAVLSPSSSERWISCPRSVRLAEALPKQPESSPYALEGTIAHDLGYVEARHAFGYTNEAQHTRERNAWRKKWDVTEEQEEEMATHIEGYVAFLKSFATEDEAVVLLEQRLDTGIPTCWGTSDAVLASPQRIVIVDLKYGMGVRVKAFENPQLMLYGLGALDTYGDLFDRTEEIVLAIYQPRINHTDTYRLSASDLRNWRDKIIPIAEMALSDNAPFGPSENACRWCPMSGQCRAQLEWATAEDFTVTPDTLSNAEIGRVLQDIPAIEAWCAAVKNLALDKAYSRQEHVPGYKVVRSNGKRYVADQQSALDALAASGYALDDISTRKINGIGALEKFLGKTDFARLLDGYISKTDGSISLVPEDDPRKAINPNQDAVKEFSE